MFIALEGVDGAGKSTLAEAVIEEIEDRYPNDEVEYLHFSQLKNDPIDEYALQFESYVPGGGHHIVCDRLHWGETIYGPLYREKSALDPAGFRWVELYLKARGATTWEVSASLETVENRLRTRGEDYLASHDVKTVWEGFSEISERSLTTGGVAMTDQRQPEELAKLIVDEALYSEERAARIFNPRYIGRHLPNVLLVGEKRGPGDPDATEAPFMARGSSSGRFLLDAVPEKWWRTIGLVNAYETNIPELLNDLFDPPVIALGAKASAYLHKNDVEHSVVPHPQKIRRFHHAKKEEYGRLLRDTAVQGGRYLSWPN